MSTLRFVSIAVLLVAIGCTKDKGDKSEKAVDAPASTTSPAAAMTAATPTEATTATKAEGMCAGEDGQDCGQEAGGCNKWDAEAAAVLKNGTPENALWKTYQVTGMKCGGCERKVIAKIGTMDGVVGVEADAELGQVRIATSPKATKEAEAARTTLDGLYKVEKAL